MCGCALKDGKQMSLDLSGTAEPGLLVRMFNLTFPPTGTEARLLNASICCTLASYGSTENGFCTSREQRTYGKLRGTYENEFSFEVQEKHLN